MEEDFELSWRDGELLLLTLEKGKVRTFDYLKAFHETGIMDEKTIRKHRDALVKVGLLEKAYDMETSSVFFSVPKKYRYLAHEKRLRKSIDEERSFSVKLKTDSHKEAILSPTLTELREYPPRRDFLELATWIKREPSGWAEDDNVKNAKLCLEHCTQLIPKIGKPHEDPDSYVFVWSEEARRLLRLQEPTSSRFFSLKLVYDAVSAALTKEMLAVGPVFVGAYCTPVIRYVGRPSEYRLVEGLQSVCVAVRTGTDKSIRVVHVETREGKLDKAWVRGLDRQLKAKKNRMVGYDSLKEDVRRSLLLKLRGVFEQNKLLISGRYAALIEDLREFSYRKPFSGYVLALAIAVDLCSS